MNNETVRTTPPPNHKVYIGERHIALYIDSKSMWWMLGMLWSESLKGRNMVVKIDSTKEKRDCPYCGTTVEGCYSDYVDHINRCLNR